MNILITNDDGIRSPGILRLAKAAKAFGNVTVVAPHVQHSGKARALTLSGTLELMPVSDFPLEGVTAYACTGTPTDCVRMGLHKVLKPDLLLSGINDGYNAGSDAEYSATVGAALEAAHAGIPAIAFSEAGSFSREYPNHTDTTDVNLEKVIALLSAKSLEKDSIYNVNFPHCAPDEVKGILEDRSLADRSYYIEQYPEEKNADGSLHITVTTYINEDEPEGTDIHAIANNYISVSTLHCIK